AAASADDLDTRLQRLIFQALVGARLPVTSWESPVPAFQLGQAAYLPGICWPPGMAEPEGAPEMAEEVIPAIDSPAELLRRALAGEVPRVVQAKGLEAALRASASDDMPRLAAVLVGALSESVFRDGLASQIRSLFISL